MIQGNIAKWNKKVGDKVKPGDALCGIETDKATVDFEMQEEGYVAKLLYPDGAKDVKLGSPLGILAFDPKDIPALADWTSGAGASKADPVQQAQTAAPAQTQATTKVQAQSSGERIFISPLAKKTALEKGLEIAQIKGTGPNARIILADVEDALRAGPAKTPEMALPAVAQPA